MAWDFAVPDWEKRIREGRSLIPDLPLFKDEAAMAVAFYDNLRLPDVAGMPRMAEASGEWFREIVATLFGSRDPATNLRHVEEIFALVAKKNSKTTNGAALMLVAMLMNQRPRAEFLFVGPTQAISDLAYSQAAGMIEADPELRKRFQIRDHIKEIKDRLNGAKLKIKTFDLKILTGPRPAGVLLDELHLLGKDPHASKVLRQLRGGRKSNSEGFLVILTTQSDEQPAGAFKEELDNARAVRDGRAKGVVLPILYEFPADIAAIPRQGQSPKWYDPAVWPMVMPNLGRSLRLDSLKADFETEKLKGDGAIRVWASQHLNIEIGLSLRSDRWAGADYWEQQALKGGLTLDELIDRSEIAVMGIDGGGLDDLLGAAVLGRDRKTRDWLLWTHAWAHQSVLARRQDIAARLLGFETDGDVTVVQRIGEDVEAVADIAERLEAAGLLPQKIAIGVDQVGIDEIVDELSGRGIDKTRIGGVPQGWKLNNAIKTTERKLAGGTLWHSGSPLMDWVVGNAKAEAAGNAVKITKQASGSAKIDPLMALYDAVVAMGQNPDAGRSFWETDEEAA
jgi:phage terminase large subunit-like protein